MNKFKHTPGPWFPSLSPPLPVGKVKLLETNMLYKHVKDKPGISGKIIAKCLHSKKETIEANAKLIAAAPDMLQLAISFVDTFNRLSNYEQIRHHFSDLNTLAETIIKKATK